MIRSFIMVLLAGLVALLLSGSGATARPPATTCPEGYRLQDVRVPGQRIESDPHSDGTYGEVVIQNEDEGDKRFVVVNTCTRRMNATEIDEVFYK